MRDCSCFVYSNLQVQALASYTYRDYSSNAGIKCFLVKFDKYLTIRAWLSAHLSGQLTWWRMETCSSNVVSGIIMWVPSESKGFLCKICAGS